MSDTLQVATVLMLIVLIFTLGHCMSSQASTHPELDKTPVYLEAKHQKQIKSKQFIEKMGPVPMWQCIEMLVRYHKYYQKILSFPPQLSCKIINKVQL